MATSAKVLEPASLWDPCLLLSNKPVFVPIGNGCAFTLKKSARYSGVWNGTVIQHRSY